MTLHEKRRGESRGRDGRGFDEAGGGGSVVILGGEALWGAGSERGLRHRRMTRW